MMPTSSFSGSSIVSALNACNNERGQRDAIAAEKGFLSFQRTESFPDPTGLLTRGDACARPPARNGLGGTCRGADQRCVARARYPFSSLDGAVRRPLSRCRRWLRRVWLCALVGSSLSPHVCVGRAHPEKTPSASSISLAIERWLSNAEEDDENEESHGKRT